MVEAYNFIGSWQLFPEKGNYENGSRPKSGIYKIEAGNAKKEIAIAANWVTLENQAFNFDYILVADGHEQPNESQEFADTVTGHFINSLSFQIIFMQSGAEVLSVLHELQPNGYLKITQHGTNKAGDTYTNTEIYHKQMSVVPYATSAGGAAVKPTQEGVIRHKALSAMEEQTNMQFEQIRRQIELLAIQAQAIQMRKELSMMIYNAKLNFVPVIGQTYYLYQRKDDTHLLSLISPKEYGGGAGPYKNFVSPVKLLADHTWMEV